MNNTFDDLFRLQYARRNKIIFRVMKVKEVIISSKSNNRIIGRKVINTYNIWSSHSKAKDFVSMFALVHPNSDFHDLSSACEKSHKTGINYFYEFSELEFIRLSKNKSLAKVTGVIKLSIPKINIEYKGNFISTCCRSNQNMDWLLNDIVIDWL